MSLRLSRGFNLAYFAVGFAALIGHAASLLAPQVYVMRACICYVVLLQHVSTEDIVDVSLLNPVPSICGFRGNRARRCGILVGYAKRQPDATCVIVVAYRAYNKTQCVRLGAD